MQHNNTKARFLVYIDNFLYNLYVATFLTLKATVFNEFNALLQGDKNCIELRDRRRLCYKSIINCDLDITNSLVVSPQIRYIEVFDITNPRFNEQIWPVPSDFIKSRFHCSKCKNN